MININREPCYSCGGTCEGVCGEICRNCGGTGYNKEAVND